MGVTCGLSQIDQEKVDELLADPSRIADYFEDEDYEFSEDEVEGKAGDLYLDKAWHGLHFLLTGAAWEAAEPLCYLVVGGQEMSDDPDDGSARLLLPAQVRAFADALAGISTGEFRRRFDPQAMKQADIYPDIWGRDPQADDALGYLVEYFEMLKPFVRQAAEQGRGLLVFVR